MLYIAQMFGGVKFCNLKIYVFYSYLKMYSDEKGLLIELTVHGLSYVVRYS